MNAYSQMLTDAIESSSTITKESGDEICNTTDFGFEEGVNKAVFDMCPRPSLF